MSIEEPTKKRSSSWSHLPEEPAEEGKRGAVATLSSSARGAATTIANGFRAGAKALAAPAATDLGAALAAADLPELGDGDPIAALALRLDRETDFWRGVGLRSLASAAWAERIAQIVSVLAGLGGLGLAVLVALATIFGTDDPMGMAVLVLSAAAAMALGCGVVALVAGRTRVHQREVAQAALRRADLGELRLHRIALLLAAKQAGPEQFAAGLVRLEQDVG